VLAFSVIYDWRLKQPTVPLEQRLLGDFSTQVRSPVMRCPTPAAVVKKRR